MAIVFFFRAQKFSSQGKNPFLSTFGTRISADFLLRSASHRIPFQIPFLPYVAPHGGKDAWGWVVDGRLVAYYHPGDIGDAWSDGHAGIKTEYWELCYQLGVNIIFYAHAEYNKWLDGLKKDED